MDIESQRKKQAILRVLAQAEEPMGSAALAGELRLIGIDLKERMVRYYLKEMDEEGWTENLGRAGRRLTARGEQELGIALAVERTGFVSARIDELAYRMDFDLEKRRGTVVANFSRFRAADFEQAAGLIRLVLAQGLGIGDRVLPGQEGDLLGGRQIRYGEVGIGTLCSMTVNGVFRAAGIPMLPRFGGLLELQEGEPQRFTQIIHYEGTTIDPVQVFVKSGLTSVTQAVRTGTGVIGAGFREIPAVARRDAQRLLKAMDRAGLGGLHALGHPGQPLLGIPVSPGRVGLVVSAGLNAIAAVEEAGIPTDNRAMAALSPYERWVPAEDVGGAILTTPQLKARLSSLLDESEIGPDRGLFD